MYEAFYIEALKHQHAGIGEYSQYAGHELADLGGCLEGDNMLDLEKCRRVFFMDMEHRNIESKKCKKGAKCEDEEDKYIHITTGWHEPCKGDQPGCWGPDAEKVYGDRPPGHGVHRIQGPGPGNTFPPDTNHGGGRKRTLRSYARELTDVEGNGGELGR